MTKTVEANFDPNLGTISLQLWTYGVTSLTPGYALTLVEDPSDLGRYIYTGVLATGRYRSPLLIGTDVVQRSNIVIGPNENTVYHLGNWEGSIDIGYAIPFVPVIPIVPILPPLTNVQVHVQAYTFDEMGQLENGVVVYVKMVVASRLSAFFDSKIAQYTSVAGVVTLTNLFQDAWYEIWRGRSTPQRFHVPITTDDIVEMDPILGNDETDPCL